jgi:ADP-dependent NAD(P)H-hydrate dehydratase / NAD(P)H-hydrate epimerase
MKILSPNRMKQYDQFAINTWGIPGPVLMENAGRSTYRLVKEEYLQPGMAVAVVCGRGNNGGDGFVIARYALRDGFRTTVFLLCDPSDLKGDALLNMELFRSLPGDIVVVPPNRLDTIKGFDVVVDAIFGTGLTKEARGLEREAIDAINACGKTIIAVDIPSGLEGEKAIPLGAAVKATHTYTYGYAKLGQIMYPGAEYTGRLTVIDISLPPSAEENVGVDACLVDGEMLRGFFRPRAPQSHKGTFGHVAVVAGSTGKSGAAVMASQATLKIGAGLVTAVVPANLGPVVEAKLTEVMKYPVDDHGTGEFVMSSYDKLRAFVEDKDIIVIGPGLSASEETTAVVRRLYSEVDKPFVVDADGINAFVGHAAVIKKRSGQAIFTPHPGEFGRLTGKTAAQVNQERLALGRAFVDEHHITLVLKGVRTTIFNDDGRIFVNPTGNPALAKGGTGDILTGFIGGLASQRYSLLESALFGTYLHGYIADTWVETHTDMDLLAGDLLDGLGEALVDIRDGTDRIYIKQSL